MPGAADRRSLVADTPRERTITHLQRLTAGASALPAALYPAIEIADTCHNHGVCAAVCPTGALQRYENDDGSGLEFDAAACIACGDCARACPEKALRVVPARQAEAAQSGVERLTRHNRRECEGCGNEFTGPGAKSLCSACEKTRDLFSTGSYGALFRAPRLAGEPEQNNPQTPL
jgi:ferredoxin